jgi:hypothetical protein
MHSKKGCISATFFFYIRKHTHAQPKGWAFLLNNYLLQIDL